MNLFLLIRGLCFCLIKVLLSKIALGKKFTRWEPLFKSQISSALSGLDSSVFFVKSIHTNWSYKPPSHAGWLPWQHQRSPRGLLGERLVKKSKFLQGRLLRQSQMHFTSWTVNKWTSTKAYQLLNHFIFVSNASNGCHSNRNATINVLTSGSWILVLYIQVPVHLAFFTLSLYWPRKLPGGS